MFHLHQLSRISSAERSQVIAVMWQLSDTVMVLASRVVAWHLGLT